MGFSLASSIESLQAHKLSRTIFRLALSTFHFITFLLPSRRCCLLSPSLPSSYPRKLTGPIYPCRTDGREPYHWNARPYLHDLSTAFTVVLYLSRVREASEQSAEETRRGSKELGRSTLNTSTSYLYGSIHLIRSFLCNLWNFLSLLERLLLPYRW